ncbi:hypothetical protein EBW23_05155 [bacterium]|nr:hypothetical protein [bacterium]
MKRSILKVVPIAVFLTVATAGCAADNNDAFVVSNIGTIGHEFLVVKTDIEDGKIALAGDHFEEPSPGLEVIDEIGEYKVGETHSLTLNLDAGNYQLVCNLPAHYGAGMHISFKVA